MNLLGTTLEGKYEIVRLIGEGGMGAVYEARHVVIGRRVAVKFLHNRFADNPQAMQRFLQEAQIAGQLGHANICEVTDVGRIPGGGPPYMIMPLLEGVSLADEMKAHDGKLPSERVFDVAYQVLTALQCAHRKGIVHRDLKPENIFLTQVGERADFVKILDFGISKVISGSGNEISQGLTTTGMVLGTPYYMAPEQARGRKNIDHRVDLYAVGVILYELLTGARPFEADSYNEIIVKIVMEPFRPPRALAPEIPEPVEAVILKAMSRSPEDRFQSAREFKHALLDRARRSAMGLPGYLTRVDMTGDVPLLDPEEVGGPVHFGDDEPARAATGARRRTLALLGAGAVVLAAGLTLALQPWRTRGGTDRVAETRPPDPAAAASRAVGRRSGTAPGAGDADANQGRAGTTKPQTVLLRFVGLPADARLQVDGRAVAGSEVAVPRGDRPIPYRATAPGGLRAEGTVRPSEDRTLFLAFRAPRPGVRAAARPTRARLRVRPKGAGRRMTRRAVGAQGGTPRLRRPAAPKAPARRVVKGRLGTEADGDYGE